MGGGYDELDLASEQLFEKYAIANRFDKKESVFVKNILQNVLPEDLRKIIASDLFEKYVQLPEDVFAKELYMNRDQIKCMKDAGMFIGIHGYDHYWLGKLPENEMKEDIDKALDVMYEFIEKDGWVMNYPYGSYNENVVKYVERRGCTCGVTTEVKIAEIGVNNKYMLPRLDCNDFPPKSDKYLEIGC